MKRLTWNDKSLLLRLVNNELEFEGRFSNLNPKEIVQLLKIKEKLEESVLIIDGGIRN